MFLYKVKNVHYNLFHLNVVIGEFRQCNFPGCLPTSRNNLVLQAGIADTSIGTTVLPAGVYSIILDSGKSKKRCNLLSNKKGAIGVGT